MGNKNGILYLYNEQNQLAAVQLDAELWRKIAPLAQKALKETPSGAPRETLAEFETFLKAWDFTYPYSPAVLCPQCGAATPDWRKDEKRPFSLRNANIGGLLVFHCKNCGATIRHKYFKKHSEVEYSPGETPLY